MQKGYLHSCADLNNFYFIKYEKCKQNIKAFFGVFYAKDASTKWMFNQLAQVN